MSRMFYRGESPVGSTFLVSLWSCHLNETFSTQGDPFSVVMASLSWNVSGNAYFRDDRQAGMMWWNSQHNHYPSLYSNYSRCPCSPGGVWPDLCLILRICLDVETGHRLKVLASKQQASALPLGGQQAGERHLWSHHRTHAKTLKHFTTCCSESSGPQAIKDP